MDLIATIKDTRGKKAIKELLSMQSGDVSVSSADTSKLGDWAAFKTNTPAQNGVQKFVDWCCSDNQL